MLVLEFEEMSSAGDQIFEFNDIQIFVSSEHIPKLQGSTIGWKESLMEEGFDIVNPQAARQCGCGESIDIQD